MLLIIYLAVLLHWDPLWSEQWTSPRVQAKKKTESTRKSRRCVTNKTMELDDSLSLIIIVVWFTRAFGRRNQIHYTDVRFIHFSRAFIAITTTATTLTRRFRSDAVCCLLCSMCFSRSYIYVSLAIEQAENFVGRLLTNFTVWFALRAIRVTSARNSHPATEHQIMLYLFLSKWKNLAVSSWIMEFGVLFRPWCGCASKHRNSLLDYNVRLSTIRPTKILLQNFILLSVDWFHRLRKNVRMLRVVRVVTANFLFISYRIIFTYYVRIMSSWVYERARASLWCNLPIGRCNMP